MNKKPDTPDHDNPEWTDERTKNAVRFDALPAGLQAKLATRAKRGPQKEPLKERITIRLSPDVVESFRATGPGWQGKIDNALKDWLKQHHA